MPFATFSYLYDSKKILYPTFDVAFWKKLFDFNKLLITSRKIFFVFWR